MLIQIDYETEVMLELPYKEIIDKVTAAVLRDEGCPYEVELNVVLTDNEAIHGVNREYRGIDSATDVLSFPMIEYSVPSDFSDISQGDGEYFNLENGNLLLGDIMISIEKVMEQAQLYGHSNERELAFLVTHSILHLLGYDHMEKSERLIMEEKQESILTKIGYLR